MFDRNTHLTYDQLVRKENKMIDSSIVWQVTLINPEVKCDYAEKALPTVFFSKSRAISYALDKKRLFMAESYLIEPLTIGDNDKAMDLVKALKEALKEEED